MRNGVSHVREIARMSLKLMEAVKVMIMIISETVKAGMIMVRILCWKREQFMSGLSVDCSQPLFYFVP